MKTWSGYLIPSRDNKRGNRGQHGPRVTACVNNSACSPPNDTSCIQSESSPREGGSHFMNEPRVCLSLRGTSESVSALTRPPVKLTHYETISTQLNPLWVCSWHTHKPDKSHGRIVHPVGNWRERGAKTYWNNADSVRAHVITTLGIKAECASVWERT